MNKILLVLTFVLLSGSCSRMVLPEDAKVVTPAVGIPAGLTGYSGSWEGYLGERKYKAIIEEIQPPKVRAVFAWAELLGSA